MLLVGGAVRAGSCVIWRASVAFMRMGGGGEVVVVGAWAFQLVICALGSLVSLRGLGDVGSRPIGSRTRRRVLSDTSGV